MREERAILGAGGGESCKDGEAGIGMLSRKDYRDLSVNGQYVRQQEIRKNGELSIPDRIVNIWKSPVRAVARGKARGMSSSRRSCR